MPEATSDAGDESDSEEDTSASTTRVTRSRASINSPVVPSLEKALNEVISEKNSSNTRHKTTMQKELALLITDASNSSSTKKSDVPDQSAKEDVSPTRSSQNDVKEVKSVSGVTKPSTKDTRTRSSDRIIDNNSSGVLQKSSRETRSQLLSGSEQKENTKSDKGKTKGREIMSQTSSRRSDSNYAKRLAERRARVACASINKSVIEQKTFGKSNVSKHNLRENKRLVSSGHSDHNAGKQRDNRSRASSASSDRSIGDRQASRKADTIRHSLRETRSRASSGSSDRSATERQARSRASSAGSTVEKSEDALSHGSSISELRVERRSSRRFRCNSGSTERSWKSDESEVDSGRSRRERKEQNSDKETDRIERESIRSSSVETNASQDLSEEKAKKENRRSVEPQNKTKVTLKAESEVLGKRVIKVRQYDQFEVPNFVKTQVEHSNIKRQFKSKRISGRILGDKPVRPKTVNKLIGEKLRMYVRQCAKCGQKFSSQSKLVKHIASIHLSPYKSRFNPHTSKCVYVCRYCNTSFKNYVEFLKHVPEHSAKLLHLLQVQNTSKGTSDSKITRQKQIAETMKGGEEESGVKGGSMNRNKAKSVATSSDEKSKVDNSSADSAEDMDTSINSQDDEEMKNEIRRSKRVRKNLDWNDYNIGPTAKKANLENVSKSSEFVEDRKNDQSSKESEMTTKVMKVDNSAGKKVDKTEVTEKSSASKSDKIEGDKIIVTRSKGSSASTLSEKGESSKDVKSAIMDSVKDTKSPKTNVSSTKDQKDLLSTKGSKDVKSVKANASSESHKKDFSKTISPTAGHKKDTKDYKSPTQSNESDSTDKKESKDLRSVTRRSMSSPIDKKDTLDLRSHTRANVSTVGKRDSKDRDTPSLATRERETSPNKDTKSEATRGRESSPRRSSRCAEKRKSDVLCTSTTFAKKSKTVSEREQDSRAEEKVSEECEVTMNKKSKSPEPCVEKETSNSDIEISYKNRTRSSSRNVPVEEVKNSQFKMNHSVSKMNHSVSKGIEKSSGNKTAEKEKDSYNDKMDKSIDKAGKEIKQNSTQSNRSKSANSAEETNHRNATSEGKRLTRSSDKNDEEEKDSEEDESSTEKESKFTKTVVDDGEFTFVKSQRKSFEEVFKETMLGKQTNGTVPLPKPKSTAEKFENETPKVTNKNDQSAYLNTFQSFLVSNAKKSMYTEVSKDDGKSSRTLEKKRKAEDNNKKKLIPVSKAQSDHKVNSDKVHRASVGKTGNVSDKKKSDIETKRQKLDISVHEKQKAQQKVESERNTTRPLLRQSFQDSFLQHCGKSPHPTSTTTSVQTVESAKNKTFSQGIKIVHMSTKNSATLTMKGGTSTAPSGSGVKGDKSAVKDRSRTSQKEDVIVLGEKGNTDKQTAGE